MLLWLAATATAAEQREREAAVNDYGPVLHISSSVLQLLPPGEQTQLLLLPVYAAQSTTPASNKKPPPRLTIGNNLDFETHYIHSNG
ncbi:uncharacterized protein LOC108605772 [Drosophila busckii]|nr:uncharacterized protein LOC108605772 [Drosophila busckii]